MSAFRWLIEAPGQQYLTACKIGSSYTFKWTKDHLKALRFMNEEQADITMMAIRELDRELFGFAATLGDAKTVEHLWLHNAAEAIDRFEREAFKLSASVCEYRSGDEHGNPLCLKTNTPI